MNVAQLISAKRDGTELTTEQIAFFIEGFSAGEIPDYQMSAMAMAIYFQGMTTSETVSLTRAMLESGEQISWPPGRPKVDKHSTGGIGDKVSIVLAPLLACCGVDVPMISGRGLGTTGGTLDKLESIKGYRTDLSVDEFRSVVNQNGCSITGASANLAPADKKLYGLRDVTGTVPSIPLITASILSKKIAEGISSLVMDVKWGSGSFMKTLEQARTLAQSLVDVGNEFGVKTSATITDMNQPLGNMIGNAVEIDESVEVLSGSGPDDVRELTLHLAGLLLINCGLHSDVDQAQAELKSHLKTGAALEKLAEMSASHGGDLSAKRERAAGRSVAATDTGYVTRIDAEQLGMAVIEMGGGRKQVGNAIDHSVGIEFMVRIGDLVKKGQTVANLFCHESEANCAASLVSESIETQADPVMTAPLIVETIS